MTTPTPTVLPPDTAERLAAALQRSDITVLYPSSDRIAAALLPVVAQIVADASAKAWDEGYAARASRPGQSHPSMGAAVAYAMESNARAAAIRQDRQS